ncbi:MAG: hypothetical protein DWH94_09360 [Planctomycetota bacterium]|nr:MAG: hypothetical protein DWH94_09360 [Planctomycetota bacterium]
MIPCISSRMLAALDCALSLLRILGRIFDRHLRLHQSDDCELARSGLMRCLKRFNESTAINRMIFAWRAANDAPTNRYQI